MRATREPELGFGDELLFRYLGPDGRVQGAFPVWVIADGGERIVVWLAAGTQVQYYATASGGDPRVYGSRIDAHDWQLDLWIGADHMPAWKDEDEAEAAVAAGYLQPEELAEARSTGDTILARLDAWLDELGDWTAWRPPAKWTIPVLPDDWAAPA